jgi:hypothetical protein
VEVDVVGAGGLAWASKSVFGVVGLSLASASLTVWRTLDRERTGGAPVLLSFKGLAWRGIVGAPGFAAFVTWVDLSFTGASLAVCGVGFGF